MSIHVLSLRHRGYYTQCSCFATTSGRSSEKSEVLLTRRTVVELERKEHLGACYELRNASLQQCEYRTADCLPCNTHPGALHLGGGGRFRHRERKLHNLGDMARDCLPHAVPNPLG